VSPLFRDQRRIRASRSGGFDVRLPAAERELLAELPGQLVELLDATAGDESAIAADPALARLFPAAYRDGCEAEANDEFRRLMMGDLRDRHRGALEVLAAGSSATHVEAEELHAWMTALTQLRLVIGTRVGITEDIDPTDVDPNHPAAGTYALYGYLSWLQEQVVVALSTTIERR